MTMYFQSFENELSLEKLWNFFADPDTSTRNLWLNMGFTMGSHIMYILPTYFGTVDAPVVKSDFPVLSSGIENEPLRIWNKLFCPQCIYNTVALNTVVVSININNHDFQGKHMTGNLIINE